MANFCIATGIAPSEYKKLTLEQVVAIKQELDKMRRAK